MKFPAAIVSVVLFLGTAHGFTQSFANLDFESANLPSIPAGQNGGYVSITDALPGWSASIDGNQITQILHNNPDYFVGNIGILGPSWTNSGGIRIIEGNYTLLLTATINTTPYSQTNSISQMGLIPISAASLLFETSPYSIETDRLQVSLDGQTLTCVPISKGPNYTLYGADISAFAGVMGTLTFSEITRGATYNGFGYLDAIQFSTSPIPEPSTLGLSMFGILLLGFLQRRISPKVN